MTMPRWWVQPTLFGLALSGLLVNIVLHLATFNAPDLPTYLGWLNTVYIFASLGSIIVLGLRRSADLRLPVATPPQSSLLTRIGAEFRAAPPFARIIYGLEAFLWGYIILLGIQFCTLLGTMKSEGYRLHVWSVLGMFLCFQWTLSAAKALGWWGRWETSGGAL